MPSSRDLRSPRPCGSRLGARPRLAVLATAAALTFSCAADRSDPLAPVEAAQQALQAGDEAAARRQLSTWLEKRPATRALLDTYARQRLVDAGRQYLEQLPRDRYRYRARELFELGKINWFDDVLDVRTPAEFASGHLPRATNIPLRQLLSAASPLSPDRHRRILLYCASGHRSAHALVLLRLLGYDQVYQLYGGFEDYRAYRTAHPEPAADAETSGDGETSEDEEADFGC